MLGLGGMVSNIFIFTTSQRRNISQLSDLADSWEGRAVMLPTLNLAPSYIYIYYYESTKKRYSTFRSEGHL